MTSRRQTLRVELLEDRQLCAALFPVNGPMPQTFPYPSDSSGDVKNMIGHPGGADSDWLDLDEPVQPGPHSYRYEAEMVPLLWLLTSPAGPQTLAVQYRETDFNFATRLMEEEGIFYQQQPAGQKKFELFDYPGEYLSRVKVQFPWDLPGSNASDSSNWVRVGIPWAGKQWGMIHIPRIGQEVVVTIDESVNPPHSHRLSRPFALVESADRMIGTEQHGRIPGPIPRSQAVQDRDIEVENDETHWVRLDPK